MSTRASTLARGAHARGLSPEQADLQAQLIAGEGTAAGGQRASQVIKQLVQRVRRGARRRRAHAAQMSSDWRLRAVEPPPEAVGCLQRHRPAMAAPGRSAAVTGEDGLGEPPKGAQTDHETGQNISKQHGKGTTTAATPVAVGAEEAVPTKLLLLAIIAVAAQRSVPDEGAHLPAMRARVQLHTGAEPGQLCPIQNVAVSHRRARGRDPSRRRGVAPKQRCRCSIREPILPFWPTFPLPNYRCLAERRSQPQ